MIGTAIVGIPFCGVEDGAGNVAVATAGNVSVLLGGTLAASQFTGGRFFRSDLTFSPAT